MISELFRALRATCLPLAAGALLGPLAACGAVEPYDEDPCRGQSNAVCESIYDRSGTKICQLSFQISSLDRPGRSPRITIDDYACETICDPEAPRCARGLVCRAAQGYPCSGGACVDVIIGFDFCQLPEEK